MNFVFSFFNHYGYEECTRNTRLRLREMNEYKRENSEDRIQNEYVYKNSGFCILYSEFCILYSQNNNYKT